MTSTPETNPRLAVSNPEDPELRTLLEEMTELGHILPARTAPPAQPDKTPAVGAPQDDMDVEELFDNCPL